jgi:cellobiose-specific phosphotransferase system component IIC
MAIFRQYIAPLLIVLVFLVALLAVSSRIFLVDDMAAPAPIEEPAPIKAQLSTTGKVSSLPPSLSALVNGLPDDAAL